MKDLGYHVRLLFPGWRKEGREIPGSILPFEYRPSEKPINNFTVWSLAPFCSRNTSGMHCTIHSFNLTYMSRGFDNRENIYFLNYQHVFLFSTANLEFHSVGTSLLMILGITSQRYLSINDNGFLHGSVSIFCVLVYEWGWFFTAIKPNEGKNSGQSQKTQTTQWDNENRRSKRIAYAKRGKTFACEPRLVFWLDEKVARVFFN